MPNLVNRLVFAELERELGKTEGMVLVSFGGLTVKETESLRNQLASKGAHVMMVRNSLARRVLANRGFELDAKSLEGNVAIAYGKAEAAIHAAKIFTSAEVKKIGKVQIRAGVLEGNLLSPSDAAALANVPDRNTLNAKILGCMTGPARGLATLLAATPSGFARLLKARAEQLEKQGGAEAAPAAAT